MTGTDPPVADDPVVVVDLTGCRSVDLALVGVLARVCLQARRAGARPVVVAEAGRACGLAALLDLVGLTGVVPLSEPGRQAEPLEEARVEEVVDVRDPVLAQLEHLQAPRLVPPAIGAGLVVGEAGRAVEVEG